MVRRGFLDIYPDQPVPATCKSQQLAAPRIPCFRRDGSAIDLWDILRS